MFALAAICTFCMLMWGGALAIPAKLGAAALIYLTLINIAALLEGRRWVVPFEVARWTVTAAAVGLFFARA